MESLHLKGGLLTAPPFSEETIIMLVTGWDYPTLMVTPQRLVQERMLVENVRGEYMAQKAEEQNVNG